MRLLLFAFTATVAAAASVWTAPVEVRHEDALCVAYQARLEGPYLVVKATLGPGWHTFAMDNQKRAAEKLAGKAPLSVDKATEITASGALEIAGPWFQTSPKDFSHPELRWFSWGFDREAVFAAEVRRKPGPAAHLTIRAQACTATICKNVDVSLNVPAQPPSTAPELDLKQLTQVR